MRQSRPRLCKSRQSRLPLCMRVDVSAVCLCVVNVSEDSACAASDTYSHIAPRPLFLDAASQNAAN